MITVQHENIVIQFYELHYHIVCVQLQEDRAEVVCGLHPLQRCLMRQCARHCTRCNFLLPRKRRSALQRDVLWADFTEDIDHLTEGVSSG